MPEPGCGDELRRRGFRRLCHFTPAANLSTIVRTGALLSRGEQRRRGIRPVELHGWGNPQRARDLADYVCLGFDPPRAMLAKVRVSVAMLELDLAVADRPGVVFAPGNTARADLALDELKAATGLEALGALFRADDGSDRRDPQSEILAADRVPLALVTAVSISAPDGSPRRLATGYWRLRLAWARHAARTAS